MTAGRRFILSIGGGLAVLLAFIGFLSVYFVPVSIDPEQRVTIPQGASLRQISQSLASAGVIRSAPVFTVMIRLRQQAHQLQAGEYGFAGRLSMADVASQLRDGRVFLYPLTIVEGITSVQIIDQINGTAFLAGPEIASLEEGSVLPDTYYFSRGTDRRTVIELMQQAQAEVLKELWARRQMDLPLKTQREAVILASIVEKETGVDRERPYVASVFINRLRLGMRLQSDPTIIYGLTGGRGLGRGIRLSELRKETPFNTYVIKGLPPAPIAHPGRAALAATLNPADSEYLYFVADGSGGHVFSKTLSEHNKNVIKWRSNRR